MIASLLHPGLILILAGLMVPFIGAISRHFIVLTVPALALVFIWMVPEGQHIAFSFLDHELQPFMVDRLSRLFVTVFSIMTLTGMIFCFRQATRSELAAALVYAGSAISVTLAGDLLTLFVFWEVMAISSTFILWSARTDKSWQAGMRYVLIHLLGGVVLMVGITAYALQTGSLEFTAMQPDQLSTWLILAGFLLNVGAPPLSAWLPDAYPEASFSGMVFLSAFTTKTAVYVLLRGYPGTELLIYIGLFMIFYGIVYALLENDMRRILAYSIVSQVGFMVCGIGIGTELALNGVAAHAFAHIIYKALLLMSAGSVLYMTGKRKCTDLGGLFQSMPVTAICGIIGALAISAFPLTSGFISKSMLTQAAADNHLLMVWLLLQAASAGTFLYVGLKWSWFIFFQKDSGLRSADPPMNMRVAMIIFSLFCIGLGIAPGSLYDILPYPVEYVPYTAEHVVVQLQLLLFAGLAFFIMLPWMQRTLTISLDFDWLYRRLLPLLVTYGAGAWKPVFNQASAITHNLSGRARQQLNTLYGPTGLLSRSMQTDVVVLWVILFLAAYLVFYFIES